MNPHAASDRGRGLSNHAINSRLMIELAAAALLCAFASSRAAAQDIHLGAIYVCNGERIAIDSCNIRDTSDSSTCMIGHPDHVNPNGLMQYTNMTRGDLKKLLPTCKQPSAQQLGAADAFQKKQQDLYNANVAKANQQAQAYNQQQQAALQAGSGQPTPAKTPEEREMRRCVSSGRLASSCTGNSLLGAFSSMLSSVISGTSKAPEPGPNMAGVFQGAGNWRLDFIDEGVLVNCSFLSPNQEHYSLAFKPTGAVLTINTAPKPLVLSVRADGTIVGPPGPVTIDGVVAGGSSGGGSTPGHTETQTYTTTDRINAYEAPNYSPSQLSNAGGGAYDATTTHTQSTYVPGTSTPPQTTFVPRRATCPAINLSSKGAGAGIQTMETDLLKTAFGGDKGPPTPPGIRMHGIFAAPSSGFSVEFFPESAILGCGPDAARAYPYTVAASGSGAVVRIEASDHPLTLALRPDGSLDPAGSAPYQVHGRVVVGQDDNDNFTFAPLEQTCNLAVLNPAKAIPATGGAAGAMLASRSGGGPFASGAGPANATLTIVSGFAAQPGAPNPLAAKPYTLLRDSFAAIVQNAGVAAAPGAPAFKAFAMACATRSPDCQKILDGVNASAASAVRSDASGSATFPAVAPGTYYLMISTVYNQQGLMWGQPVQLNAGANTVKLDQSNATPLK